MTHFQPGCLYQCDNSGEIFAPPERSADGTTLVSSGKQTLYTPKKEALHMHIHNSSQQVTEGSFCAYEQFLDCIESKPKTANAVQEHGMSVRAITLWQPWASLIALGLKRHETRSWSTNYRGKLLIHAAARTEKYEEKEAIANKLKGTKHYAEIVKLFGNTDFPYGCIVAIADLTACQKMWAISQMPSSPMWADDVRASETEILIDDQPPLELTVGLWEPGRFAWRLENVQPITPIPCKGKQGLWIPSEDLVAQILGGNLNG